MKMKNNVEERLLKAQSTLATMAVLKEIPFSKVTDRIDMNVRRLKRSRRVAPPLLVTAICAACVAALAVVLSTAGVGSNPERPISTSQQGVDTTNNGVWYATLPGEFILKGQTYKRISRRVSKGGIVVEYTRDALVAILVKEGEHSKFAELHPETEIIEVPTLAFLDREENSTGVYSLVEFPDMSVLAVDDSSFDQLYERKNG